ncbi:unnamed protein product [Allacma fusca]|uniref:Uncharacterized protein n=1 Tax=Allacma fusca TaxID=39272 RepID=A0A8J2J3P4_9HEXA|nr:unnamed protein product [Allacma fusca]
MTVRDFSIVCILRNIRKKPLILIKCQHTNLNTHVNNVRISNNRISRRRSNFGYGNVSGGLRRRRNDQKSI